MLGPLEAGATCSKGRPVHIQCALGNPPCQDPQPYTRVHGQDGGKRPQEDNVHHLYRSHLASDLHGRNAVYAKLACIGGVLLLGSRVGVVPRSHGDRGDSIVIHQQDTTGPDLVRVAQSLQALEGHQYVCLPGGDHR